MLAVLLLGVAPVASADHAEDARDDVNRALERADARVESLDERRARLAARADADDADRLSELDAERAALVEDAARFREARAFLAGLDPDVVHAADADVVDALTGLVEDARDADEDIERLQERRARLEERFAALDANDTERRDRLDFRIAEVDVEIGARAFERDQALARFDAFTRLDVRDDPARLVFAVDALDALEDLDRQIDRVQDRIDRLLDRRADLQARLGELDDERGDTLRRLSLETRIQRVNAELVDQRAERELLESARDALATLDADVVDDALLARAGVRLDAAFADVEARAFDEDEEEDDAPFTDDASRASATASGGATASRESDLELDDVLNALALA